MKDDSTNLATLISESVESNPEDAVTNEAHAAVGPATDTDICRHCGAVREPDYPMCRKCGFYEKLNTFVEVDQIDPDDKNSQEQPGKLPPWAWILIGVLGLIFLESVAVTFLWPCNSVPRMVWSLSQLALGLIVMLVAHGRATFIAIMENSENEIGDCIIRPLKIWACVTAELPRTLTWVTMGSGGLLAILLSVFLIRSIPFNALFETEEPPPKKKRSLASAIAEQAKAEQAQEQEMEDAMKDFADKAGVEQDSTLELSKVREKTECVIVGFYAPDDQEGDLSSILVAGAQGKKLKILGTISLDVEEDVRSSLNNQLRAIQRPTPFVETTLKARWVRPLILCEVSFTRDKKGNPRDFKFERVTGQSNTPTIKK